MNRAEKAEQVEQLQAEIARATSVFVVNFEKVPVAADWELRRQVKTAGGKYRVVKNSLVELGAKGTPLEPILKSLVGPTALALTAANPVAVAKALSAYAKENPDFKFRVGWVEGRAISLAEIAELILLPGKEELLAKAVYLISAPARGVVSAIQAVFRNLASVIDQAVKESKFSQS